MPAIDLTIPVPVAALPDGVGQIAVTLHWPVALPPRPTVVFALPGGGYSRGYFNLSFPGHEGYSEAEYLTGHGIVLVAMDHLGVGNSSTAANDLLIIEDIVAANDAAVRFMLEMLPRGMLDPALPRIYPGFVVGSGQSMGGGVTIIMQGRHRTYDAIAPLGYSAVHTSLPQRSPELRQALKAFFGQWSRQTLPADLSVPQSSEHVPDFLYPFHCEDVPADVVAADLAGGYPLRTDPPAWGSRTVPRCVVAMMTRGYVAPEAAVVEVPVFVGLGERDVSEDPSLEPSMFPRARDVTVYVVPGMAHMHNFAGTRQRLWRRFVAWMGTVRDDAGIAGSSD